MAMRAMGTRLSQPGRERVTIAGTLQDDSGSRRVHITLQMPKLFRLEESGGKSRVITFNGNKLTKAKDALDEDDRRLLESVVLDSPEMLFQAIDNGSALRRLGGYFREDDGKAKVYTGRYLDYYQLFPPAEEVDELPASYRHARMVAFDSESQLLAKVWYREAGVQVETEFANWRDVNGEKIPGQVIRRESGRVVLRLTVDSADVGGKSPDAQFGK